MVSSIPPYHVSLIEKFEKQCVPQIVDHLTKSSNVPREINELFSCFSASCVLEAPINPQISFRSITLSDGTKKTIGCDETVIKKIVGDFEQKELPDVGTIFDGKFYPVQPIIDRIFQACESRFSGSREFLRQHVPLYFHGVARHIHRTPLPAPAAMRLTSPQAMRPTASPQAIKPPSLVQKLFSVKK